VGRELTFGDPQIVRMATRDYIAVAADDWYQRRRDDAEGKFFRKVADQGPRKGEGGSTRQGIYCFTADGQLLVYRNHQEPSVMRETLRQGLAAWKKLPENRRKPGAIAVAEQMPVDRRFARTPPPRGLIVNVYTRILDHDSSGHLCKGQCGFKGGDRPARDHLWLTEADVKGLHPAHAHVGDTFALPAALTQRILRFHLIDNTRGEPPYWEGQHIRSCRMTLTVENADGKALGLRLDGAVLLSTDADPARAKRGFDVRLRGYIRFEEPSRRVSRFDLVAVGDHWGEGTYTRGARPGRKPLGIAFTLADGKSAADRVPPQGAREIGVYLSGGGE
jgi:hypothetical protein